MLTSFMVRYWRALLAGLLTTLCIFLAVPTAAAETNFGTTAQLTIVMQDDDEEDQDYDGDDDDDDGTPLLIGGGILAGLGGAAYGLRRRHIRRAYGSVQNYKKHKRQRRNEQTDDE